MPGFARFPDNDTKCFEIKSGTLLGDTLALPLFINVFDYVLK